MSRTRIKMCGMTRIEDVRLAVELGVDAVGFVFWPSSSRFVTVEQAARLAAIVPPIVSTVGVFVNQSLEDIRRAVADVGLTQVQLHGDDPTDTWTRMPCRVIKAVGVDEAFDPETLVDWPASVMPLLDANDRERRGGTGRPIDWMRAAAAARIRPIMLAGGLRPDNVEDAVRIVAPFGVDVASGIEQAPGVKNPTSMRAFVAAVNRANTGSTS